MPFRSTDSILVKISFFAAINDNNFVVQARPSENESVYVFKER